MTALCVRGPALLRPLVWLSAALFLTVALASSARAGEPILVMLDQARLIKLPERAATVVIGDPLIADVTVQTGDIAVITGKGYGMTNIIVADQDGAVLMENDVEVKGPNGPLVIVYRGMTRQTYSCSPDCLPRITLGDTGKDYFDDKGVDRDFFKSNIEQSNTRDDSALKAGGGSDEKKDKDAKNPNNNEYAR